MRRVCASSSVRNSKSTRKSSLTIYLVSLWFRCNVIRRGSRGRGRLGRRIFHGRPRRIVDNLQLNFFGFLMVANDGLYEHHPVRAELVKAAFVYKTKMHVNVNDILASEEKFKTHCDLLSKCIGIWALSCSSGGGALSPRWQLHAHRDREWPYNVPPP